jgi:hypothetical protein
MKFRRFAPFLAALFAANIAAQAAGAECVMPQMRMDNSVAHAQSAMADMNAPSIDVTFSPVHESQKLPCDVPGIPASCASFASCGSAVLGLGSQTFAMQNPVNLSPSVRVLLVPESLSVLPELPPPRA